MGAPAEKRCGLHKAPDLQTDNSTLWVCECVGGAGRCRDHGDGDLGEVRQCGWFFRTNVSPSVTA